MSKHRRISIGTFFGLLLILGISIVFNRGRGFAPRYFNKIDLKKGAGKEGDEPGASSENRIDESTIFGGVDIRIPVNMTKTNSSNNHSMIDIWGLL